jgi:8-oxo-dGTP pyrophosphatase MutT (NUDIX family)
MRVTTSCRSDAAVAPLRLTCWGGKREPGEGAHACIVRECREELGGGGEPTSLERVCDLFVDGRLVAWFYEGGGPVCPAEAAQLAFEEGRGGAWVQAGDPRISPWHATVLAAWARGEPRADHRSATEAERAQTAQLLQRLADKHAAAAAAAADCISRINKSYK